MEHPRQAMLLGVSWYKMLTCIFGQIALAMLADAHSLGCVVGL